MFFLYRRISDLVRREVQVCPSFSWSTRSQSDFDICMPTIDIDLLEGGGGTKWKQGVLCQKLH